MCVHVGSAAIWCHADLGNRHSMFKIITSPLLYILWNTTGLLSGISRSSFLIFIRTSVSIVVWPCHGSGG
jgi:hypothetical protein